MKLNNFRGDLTDVSAKTEALPSSLHRTKYCVFYNVLLMFTLQLVHTVWNPPKDVDWVVKLVRGYIFAAQQRPISEALFNKIFFGILSSCQYLFLQ